MDSKKKTASVSKECVACGCCMKSCPLGAIRVHKGICALVDSTKCVGCQKCAVACPGQLISFVAGEAAS